MDCKCFALSAPKSRYRKIWAGLNRVLVREKVVDDKESPSELKKVRRAASHSKQCHHQLNASELWCSVGASKGGVDADRKLSHFLM